MRRDYGPPWVFNAIQKQIRVGKKKEWVIQIELRQDAKAGDKLIVTKRDLMFMHDFIWIEEEVRPQQNNQEKIQNAIQ